MIAGGELIKKPERIKTLYYGLRLNHPRNVALLHPVMFTIRRLVYALSIVTLSNYPLFGVWLMMIGTCIMLAFALTEMPWRDPLVNNQHIFNELMTYFVCIILLLFNAHVPTNTRITLGYGLIAIITIFLVYNGLIIVRKVTRLGQLMILKWRKLRQVLRLRVESRTIMKKIKLTLDGLTKPEVPSGDDSDLEWQQQVAAA